MNTQDAAAVVVIFGAAGDLTRGKLLPALYNLFLDRQLPERFAILGLDRIALDDEAFRGQMREGVDQFLADATLFMRAEQVEAAWAIVDPILNRWEAERPSDFPNYRAGSWGPASADALMTEDSRGWYAPPA
jgi:glucose-6-phosphate 1-dehydrogenase